MHFHRFGSNSNAGAFNYYRILIDVLFVLIPWRRGIRGWYAGKEKKGKRQGTKTAKELYVFSSH